MVPTARRPRPETRYRARVRRRGQWSRRRRLLLPEFLYFTLAITDLPEEIAKKLPRYDAIPAALIGRLARDVRVRGQGVGDLLLADAIRRILGAARSVAVFAIVVDAKDEPAAAFYRRFGFRPFPNRPLRLFMSSAVAAAALERS